MPKIYCCGFSLLEMLITLSLVITLCALSLPYMGMYFVHAHRQEATQALTHLALQLEQYHFENSTYATATFEKLNIQKCLANKKYLLEMQLNDNAFILFAIPQKEQMHDECGILSLNDLGEHHHTGQAENCW